MSLYSAFSIFLEFFNFLDFNKLFYVGILKRAVGPKRKLNIYGPDYSFIVPLGIVKMEALY